MYAKSGADIDNLINEVTFYVIRHQMEEITEQLLIDFIDNIDLGKVEPNKPSRKSLETVAYHEAGHAVVGWFLEYSNPLVI